MLLLEHYLNVAGFASEKQGTIFRATISRNWQIWMEIWWSHISMARGQGEKEVLTPDTVSLCSKGNTAQVYATC